VVGKVLRRHRNVLACRRRAAGHGEHEHLVVGEQGAGLAAADTSDIRLEVFIAGHGELATEIAGRVDGGETVLAAKVGLGVIRKDALEERLLHFLGSARRILEGGDVPQHRAANQLGDRPEKESWNQHGVDLVKLPPPLYGEITNPKLKQIQNPKLE